MRSARQTPSWTPDTSASDRTHGSGTRTKFTGRTVLVVDDHEDNRELFSTILRDAGFVVTTAHDGLAALATAARERPAVIIMDLGMPGMDGFETIARLRCEEHGRAAYILVVSALDDRATRARVAELGADAFQAKPCPPGVLLTRVEQAFTDPVPQRATAG